MVSSFNSGSHSGNFLCSGRKGDFNATGELGQPVYGVAVALREAIRRSSKTELPLAHFLAIPQPDESGEHIDWYADPGISDAAADGATVINWNAATAAEKLAAKPKLLAFEEAINAFSARLLQSSSEAIGDKHTFAKLLPKVLTTPSRLMEAKGYSQERYILDPSYVFLVGPNQQPVLAFWGFSHPQSATITEPFHFLNTPAIATVAATQAVPTVSPSVLPAALAPAAAALPTTAVTGFNWWRILRWLLLLLLLLLALFFVWRSCTTHGLPTLPGLSMGTPNISTPNVSTPKLGTTPPKQTSGFNFPKITWPGFMANWGPGSGAASGVPQPVVQSSTAPSGTLASLAPGVAAFATEPTLVPTQELIPEVTPALEPVLPEMAPESSIELPQADAANANLTNPPAIKIGPELQIPPELSSQAVPSYINGQWQVHAIQDQQTGRPVRLEYAIQDGQGQVRIQQGNGVSCQGPVQATGQSAGLLINSLGQAQCDDGSRYQMPEVLCSVNANQETECLGRYDGSPAFPISMRHATD